MSVWADLSDKFPSLVPSQALRELIDRQCKTDSSLAAKVLPASRLPGNDFVVKNGQGRSVTIKNDTQDSMELYNHMIR